MGDLESDDDRQTATAALIEILAGEPAIALSAGAVRSLGELGQLAALEPIVKAMDSTDSSLRQLAAVSLGRLAVEGCFDALENALANGPSDVRYQAARSLVEIDPERAAAPLLASLANQEDPEIVGALALGVGEIGDRANADAIAVHLESPRDETRFEVAYSLALLGDGRGLEILASALDGKQTAWDAIDGLERIATERAADALASVQNLRRVAPEIPLRAAGALVAIAADHEGADDARKFLLASLSAWKHHLRALAIAELGRVGGPWAFAELNRLRSRRRGALLREEIDDALEAITSRADERPGDPSDD